ncbi:DUF5719 family protein [Trueperella sp. HMSC08H06]|uniref:DUF5719 family protein n=1 Tax=Trueperella sp. HMSC08H06 TaxID=1581142 RepID=UPI0008A656EE|nr:DUF5719 family protein [Trueperella sp. HMSC08H06]OFS67072.1 hypothetical protein HMPREF3174_04625 [Trueperella sp. HMSC08H06]
MKKELAALVSGVGVLALAAGAGLATAMPAAQPAAPTTVAAPQGQAGPSQASLVCYAHAQDANTGGINVSEVVEGKSSWAGVLSDGAATFDSTPFTGVLTQIAGGQAVGVVRGKGVMAGASIQTAQAGDSRGLIAAPCEWPANTVWLVGGSSEVGTWLSLMVRNASATATTIDIAVYSSAGQLDIQGLSTLSLEAGGEATRDLTGLIPPDSRIAIRLSSDTGAFVAAMQVLQLDGVTPAGIDMLTDSAAGTDVVIPGVVVDADTTAALRIVNPHDEPTTVNVATLGEEERPLDGAQGVEVAPQSVLDLSLAGLAPGSYGVRVSARTDVAVGVSLTRSGDDGVDVAWLAGREPVTAGGIAAGPHAGTLVLNGSGQARWTSYDVDGAQLDSQVLNVDEIASVEIPAEAHYVTLEADQPMYGAALLHTDTGIAWLALTQDSTTSQAVRLTIAN